MGLLYTVSFWVIFISLILSCIIGHFTHWIIGTVIFFLLTGKTLIVSLIMDTISSSLKYHHDRQDERVKKTISSLLLTKAAKNGVRPDTKVRLTKF